MCAAAAAIELAFEPGRETVVRRLVRDAELPAGGMRPARTFRTTFSQTAASAATAREIERIEGDGHHAALFLSGGVTGQTVALERRAIGSNW